MQTSKRLLTRSEYRSRIIMAHSRVREAERLIFAAVTTCGGAPYEVSPIERASTELLEAALALRDAVARVGELRDDRTDVGAEHG